MLKSQSGTKMRILLILTLLPFTAFSLTYDLKSKTYNDLLVSISPDLPGLMILRLEWIRTLLRDI